MRVISVVYCSIVINVYLTVVLASVTALLGYFELEFYSKLSAKYIPPKKF